MDSICDLVGVNACFILKICLVPLGFFCCCFSFWSSMCFFCRSWWLFATVYQEFREGEDQWGPAAAHHTSGARGSGSQPHRPSGADFGSGWPSVCTGKGIIELVGRETLLFLPVFLPFKIFSYNFFLFLLLLLFTKIISMQEEKKKSPNYQSTGCGIFLLHCIWCVMPCQITN